MQNETPLHRQKNECVLASLSFQPGIPEKIQQKAKGLLRRYFAGERLCKKVKCSGKKGGAYRTLKIDIGAFWRLLSLDNGENWQLISHERYNKIISRS